MLRRWRTAYLSRAGVFSTTSVSRATANRGLIVASELPPTKRPAPQRVSCRYRKRQLLRGNRERHTPNISRAKSDALKSLQLPDRPRNPRHIVANVELHHFITGARTRIRHAHTHGQRIRRTHRRTGQPQTVIRDRNFNRPPGTMGRVPAAVKETREPSPPRRGWPGPGSGGQCWLDPAEAGNRPGCRDVGGQRHEQRPGTKAGRARKLGLGFTCLRESSGRDSVPARAAESPVARAPPRVCAAGGRESDRSLSQSQAPRAVSLRCGDGKKEAAFRRLLFPPTRASASEPLISRIGSRLRRRIAVDAVLNVVNGFHRSVSHVAGGVRGPVGEILAAVLDPVRCLARRDR